MNFSNQKGFVPPSGLQATTLDQILVQLTSRIDTLVDEESAILDAASPEDIDRFIARKNHLAFEVTRIVQQSATYVPSAEVKLRLATTLQKLEANAAQVRRHVSALEEIAAILAGIQEDAVSDGTYSTTAFFRPATK